MLTLSFKPLTKAVHHALVIGALSVGQIGLLQATQANTSVSQNYQIPADALETVLLQFAAQAGVELSFDAKHIANLKSTGLKGQYSITDGFNTLLAPHGFQVQKTSTGYKLIEKPKNNVRDLGQLNLIDVNAQRTQTDIDPNAVQLPVITITAADDGYAPSQLNSKLGSSLKEIPQSISVIARQQLDDMNATTLESVMRYAAGISAYGNTDGSDVFYARNGAVNLSYNGVPSTANNQFDMAIYDQVEVLRGPSGLLNGSGNPTGTINLVRKRALDQFQAQVATSIGSWQNYRTEIDVTNALNQQGTIRGRAIVVGEDREYFYDHANSDKILGGGILEFDLSPDTILGVAATIQQANLTPFSGFPGDNKGNLLGLPRSTNLDAKYNKATRDTWEITSDLTHQFNENWKTQATVRYYEGKYKGISGNPRGAVDTDTNQMRFDQSRSMGNQENVSADINVKGSFDLFGQKHDVLFGYNYDNRWSESGSASLAMQPSANWYNPGYANASDIPNYTRKSETETIQSGIYGMLRIKPIQRLSIILGSRFTDYSHKTRTTYPTAEVWKQGAKETGEFTPYGGLVFDITKDINWYASYADVFTPQTTTDYKMEVLKPIVGWQVETGFKGSFYDGRLNTSLAVFRVREENSPVNDPDPTHECVNATTGQVVICQVAGGLVQTEGVEAEISGEVFTGFNVSASYTHSDKTPLAGGVGKGSIGTANKSTTSSPRDVFKLWANYKFQPHVLNGKLDGLSLGGGIYAVGETYGWSWTDYDLKQGGYTTVSLQGAYQFDQNLSASLSINNLFDKTYYHQLNDERSYNNYGDPRNFMLKLTAKY